MARQVPAAFDRQGNNTHPLPTIIRRKTVEARTGLSRSTIYDRVAEGTFPAPVNLGARAVGWVEAEVSQWLFERIEASRKAEG
jgi:prophage regulatory protein